MNSKSDPGRIACTEAARERIREHVDGELEREVGGFLAGRLEDGRAHVEVAMPALRAEGHRTNVTFTHDVWDDVLVQLDREHPDLQLVGWYHSHPGFGIFLSEYDQFIHRNFFPAEGMVALVVDPHTGADGWFVTRDGDIARADGDEPVGNPRDRPTAPPSPAAEPSPSGAGTSSRGVLVLVGAGALLAGFVAGWLTGDADRIPDTANDELIEARQEQEELAADLQVARERAEEAERLAEVAASDAEEASPDDASDETSAQGDAEANAEAAGAALIYRVRPGDTLSQLAASLASDPEAYLQRIIEANPQLDNPDVIAVGTEVRLPLP